MTLTKKYAAKISIIVEIASENGKKIVNSNELNKSGLNDKKYMGHRSRKNGRL